jgi:hypothetical protein
MPEQRPSNNNAKSNNTDNLIDLAGVQQTDRIFECEFCSVALLPYPALRIQNPYAGDGYICPQCGTITDSSYTPMRAQVRIEPVDVGDSSNVLETVPEDKGRAFDDRPQPYDPEPQEDEQIKAMGGKILNRRVVVNRDY